MHIGSMTRYLHEIFKVSRCQFQDFEAHPRVNDVAFSYKKIKSRTITDKAAIFWLLFFFSFIFLSSWIAGFYRYAGKLQSFILVCVISLILVRQKIKLFYFWWRELNCEKQWCWGKWKLYVSGIIVMRMFKRWIFSFFFFFWSISH